MIDRPLIRIPLLKPEQDRWMLDRWTPFESHQVICVYREVKDREGRVVEKVYRTTCACGWRSIEYHAPFCDPCPVGQALTERAFRLKRDFERVEWKQVTP